MKTFWSLEWNIFVLMGVGFLLRRIGLLKKEAERALTDLVLYVVLPCSIFKSFIGSQADAGRADCLAALLVSVGIQALALLYARFAFPAQHPDRRASLGFSMICSNAGFLGNPVAEGLFGAGGLMLASIYLIPQRIMMWSEGLAMFSGVSDKRTAVKKVLTHPCVIACFLGLIVMATGWTVPELILTPVRTVAQCNTPLSMMVIGMILTEMDVKALKDRTILLFALHRLVLMPLIVYLACLALPVSASVRGVCTILAAMPAGATSSMLAAKYGRDPQFAARLVVFTTLCSIPAIVVWSLILV